MKKLCIAVAMLLVFATATSAQNMTLPEGYTTCETCGTKTKTTVTKKNNDAGTTTVVQKKETKKIVYVSGNTTYKKNTGNCNNQQYKPQNGNQGNGGQTAMMVTGMVLQTGMQIMNRFLPMNGYGYGGYGYSGGYGMMPMNNFNGYNNGYYNGMTQPFIW